MKQYIITTLLVLVALAGQAKDIIWENPSAFMGNYNGMFFINQVELKPTETVLHITANYLPHNWIRFDKHSYLQTPDGKKYGITNEEYELICVKLEKELSFGKCGWCS